MQLYALAILGLVSGERILRSFILSYNGDRITNPLPHLTSIGARQCSESGRFYHNRYFNEFPIPGFDQVYDPGQFSVMLPMSDVHHQSMLSWTQEFYPKVNYSQTDNVEVANLANGTKSDALSTYQYVRLEGINEDSSRHWIIKGDDYCPNYSHSQRWFGSSSWVAEMHTSTYNFYQSLAQYNTGLSILERNFEHAQIVYDHFLVRGIHDESFRESIGGLDGEVFQQVKTLQDIYSVKYNTWTKSSLISGMTLLEKARAFLSDGYNASHPAYVQVVAGSSNQFYRLFKLLDLYSSDESRFTGIVNYAATLVIELFARDGSNDRFVRVGIRNGTTVSEGNVTLDFFPVFNNTENYMSYDDFQNKLSSVVIADVGGWCNACSSSVDACQAIKLRRFVDDYYELKSKYVKYLRRMSLATAGGIGAGAAIGVVLVVWSLVCCCKRRRKPNDRESEALTSVSTPLQSEALRAVPSPPQSQALTLGPPPPYKSKRTV